MADAASLPLQPKKRAAPWGAAEFREETSKKAASGEPLCCAAQISPSAPERKRDSLASRYSVAARVLNPQPGGHPAGLTGLDPPRRRPGSSSRTSSRACCSRAGPPGLPAAPPQPADRSAGSAGPAPCRKCRTTRGRFRGRVARHQPAWVMPRLRASSAITPGGGMTGRPCVAGSQWIPSSYRFSAG
jgi:hypothetical protein